MIIVVKNSCEHSQFENLMEWIKDLGLDVHVSRGVHTTILGLVGDTSKVDIDLISSLDMVDRVQRVQEPYKNANRNSFVFRYANGVGNLIPVIATLGKIYWVCKIGLISYILSAYPFMSKTNLKRHFKNAALVYNDVFTFSKMFKQYYGVSPLQFKK